MIGIRFIYPFGDGYGSYSFSLFPCVVLDYDGENKVKSIEVMWMFWGLRLRGTYEKKEE